jgi:hypothetical protein
MTRLAAGSSLGDSLHALSVCSSMAMPTPYEFHVPVNLSGSRNACSILFIANESKSENEFILGSSLVQNISNIWSIGRVALPARCVMAPLARDGDDVTVHIAGFFIVIVFVVVVALCGCMNSREAAACVDDGLGSACITCALI